MPEHNLGFTPINFNNNNSIAPTNNNNTNPYALNFGSNYTNGAGNNVTGGFANPNFDYQNNNNNTFGVLQSDSSNGVPSFGNGPDNNNPEGYQGLAAGVGTFNALASAYTGYQSLQLGRDQFNLAKDSFNTNLANQAVTVNQQIRQREAARLASTGQFSNTPQGQAELEAALDTYGENNNVSGAPV